MSQNSQPPIFILSCERSGSTLLRYILDTHPEVACPGELYLGQLIRALSTTLSRSLALTQTNDPEEVDRLTWREVNQRVAEILSKYAQNRGKKRWCEKSPANLQNLPEIDRTFPDTRYICLYRDGLDVVHSGLEMRKKSNVQDWTVGFEANHPELIVAVMLESWVQKNETLLAFETTHPRTYRLRYEDLIQNPVQTLEPLFQFLDLTWDPSLLERVFTTSHDGGGGDDKILETTRIEKDRVGLGTAIDPALLSKIPPELQERRKKLNLALGYSTS